MAKMLEETLLFLGTRLANSLRFMDDGSVELVAKGEILKGGQATERWHFIEGKWQHEYPQDPGK